MACVLGNKTKGIQDLPENLLLEILTYLPRKDLCRACRVCRQWRRVGGDNHLWRHVDMTLYKLDLQRLWKVVRAHFSDVLLTLKIGGFMTPKSTQWNKSSFSDAMLKELCDRCPNLRHLSFYQTNLTNLSADLLPTSLRSLEIESSTMPLGWLQNASEKKALPNLRRLSMKKSTKLNNADLKDICKFKDLETLNISGCYRITESSLKAIADLHKLNELDISETDSKCTDILLHLFGRQIPELKVLKLSGLQSITDAGIGSMASCLKDLETLHVDGCIGLKDSSLEHIKRLKKLKQLSVKNCNFGEEAISEFKKTKSECIVLV